jgi:hypothetical protein
MLFLHESCMFVKLLDYFLYGSDLMPSTIW